MSCLLYYFIDKLNSNVSRENWKFLLDLDGKLLDDMIMYIFTQTKKEIVLFLLKNNKIGIHMNEKLLNFIIENNFYDLFYFINYEIFDIHLQNDKSLLKTILKKEFDISNFLISKGADIHAKNDRILKKLIINNDLISIKYLISLDFNYYSKNLMLKNVIKDNFLFEYYDLFCIPYDQKYNILYIIQNNDLDSIKNVENYHFSNDKYELYFVIILSKHYEMSKYIYDNKIDNKNDLKFEFNKISYLFDEESINHFNNL